MGWRWTCNLNNTIDTLIYPSISHWEVVSLTDVKLCSITLRNTIHLTGRSFLPPQPTLWADIMFSKWKSKYPCIYDSVPCTDGSTRCFITEQVSNKAQSLHAPLHWGRRDANERGGEMEGRDARRTIKDKRRTRSRRKELYRYVWSYC